MGRNIQKHTTNYADVFITVSEDTKTLSSKTPKPGTIAYLQYQLITENPYQFTSDEIMFKVHAMRTPGVKENSQKDYLEFFLRQRPASGLLHWLSPMGSEFISIRKEKWPFTEWKQKNMPLS